MGGYAASFDARACSCYVCCVPNDTRGTDKRVGFGAEAQTVELAPGVTLECAQASDSTVRVRLVVEYADRKEWRRYGEGSYRRQSTEFVSDRWTMLIVYSLCWEWFFSLLFWKRGGFRAAVRAVRILKDARDACRVRRLLLDECVEISGSEVPRE